MCTFFVRCAVIALSLTGCSRAPATVGIKAVPAPRADTITIAVPVLRLTTTDSSNGSAPLDSAALELIERRVMSRVASIMRAQVQLAAGAQTAGIVPVKNGAPQIRPGLLGTIAFAEDGSLSTSSRDRITAIARLLDQLEGTLEIHATGNPGSREIDVALGRARRVYVELLEANRSLADRAVEFIVSAAPSLNDINPSVDVFYRPPR